MKSRFHSLVAKKPGAEKVDLEQGCKGLQRIASRQFGLNMPREALGCRKWVAEYLPGKTDGCLQAESKFIFWCQAQVLRPAAKASITPGRGKATELARLPLENGELLRRPSYGDGIVGGISELGGKSFVRLALSSPGELKAAGYSEKAPQPLWRKLPFGKSEQERFAGKLTSQGHGSLKATVVVSKQPHSVPPKANSIRIIVEEDCGGKRHKWSTEITATSDWHGTFSIPQASECSKGGKPGHVWFSPMRTGAYFEVPSPGGDEGFMLKPLPEKR